MSSAGKNPDEMTGNESINLKMIIEYDGAAYFGWQRQKDKKSVQQSIEESLSKLLREKQIVITGAGRTDAGVHALNQCANFKISKAKIKEFGIKKLHHSLNAVLPDDIAIKSLRAAKPDFHSRYSAKKREYIYLITENKIAVNNEKVYLVKQKLDLNIAEKFCKAVIGRHNFRSLCKNKDDDHGFLCDVFSAGIKKKKNGIIEFKITANRFLHSMVRGVTGAMVKVASGGLSLNEFIEKFKKGEEIKIQYLPSKALFLSKVTY